MTLLLSLPAAAWANGQAPGVDAGAFLRMIGALLLVVLFIVGLTWALRRVSSYSGSAQGRLRALASLSVGTRERVVLIQVGEQQLLVGVGPGRVQTLLVLDEPIAGSELKSAGEAPDSAFAQKLRGLMQQK